MADRHVACGHDVASTRKRAGKRIGEIGDDETVAGAKAGRGRPKRYGWTGKQNLQLEQVGKFECASMLGDLGRDVGWLRGTGCQPCTLIDGRWRVAVAEHHG